MKRMMKYVAATLLYAIALPAAMAGGFYGAFDVGQTSVRDTCNGGLAGACSDTSTALRLGGGYQFVPMWAAEVSYGTYGKASTGTAAGDWQTSGLQASGVGTFPVWEAISVIGKVGLARTDFKLTTASRSSTTTNLAIGVGAQYAFSKVIDFRAQYENLGTIGDANTTGTTKLILLSAGVLFRF